MKDIEKITAALLEPFDPMDIESRIQKHGMSNGKRWAMVLAYVTNRAIMERLDEVFGIGGWQNEYVPLADGGFLCGIKAKVPINDGQDSEWIVKWDGADKTAVEATKGGISSAMKRTGVQWGIGRYLYRLDTHFATLVDGRGDGSNITTSIKDGNGVYLNVHFRRPALPNFAIPKGES